MLKTQFLARAAAVALALGGCGDDAKSPAADPAQFVGTWNLTGGMLKLTCPALPPGTTDAFNMVNDEKVMVRTSASAPLEAEWRSCKVLMDINGQTATARAGQTCMFDFAVPIGRVTGMGSVTSGVLTLKVGGLADYAQKGNGMLKIMTPIAAFDSTCDYDVSSPAAKLP